MTSSLSITLIALGIIAALAFFTAAGFRGSGKVSDCTKLVKIPK